MSKEQITNPDKNDQYYLTRLEQKLAELKNELSNDEARLKEIQDDKPMSSDDVGSQRDDRETLEQQIANTNDLINEAERALGWTKEHGFVCAFPGCKNKIEPKRLEVDISSITCIEHRDEEDKIEL